MTLADDGENPNYAESLAWSKRLLAKLDEQEAELEAEQRRTRRNDAITVWVLALAGLALIIIGQVFK